MNLLNNARHERFAAGLADGLSQEKAYIAAGFFANGARGSASTLIKQYPYILKRRDEILAEREKMHSVATAQAIEALQITKEDIMRELWDNARRAKAAVSVLDREGNETGVYNTNIPASNQALHLLGKELGMFLEKKNVPQSEYSRKSVEELRQIVIEKAWKLGVPLPPILGEFNKVGQK